MQVGEIADMCLIGRTFGVVHNLWIANKWSFKEIQKGFNLFQRFLQTNVVIVQRLRRFSCNLFDPFLCKMPRLKIFVLKAHSRRSIAPPNSDI